MTFNTKVAPVLDRLKYLLAYNAESGLFIWLTHRSGQRPPGSIAGSVRHDGYIAIRIDGVRYMAHHLAWYITSGVWPKDTELDHINLVKDDNRIDNLRFATHGQNMSNVRPRPRKNGGSLKGAYLAESGRWWSAIRSDDGKCKRLGIFDTESEAHAAYVMAASIKYGEFARAS